VDRDSGVSFRRDAGLVAGHRSPEDAAGHRDAADPRGATTGRYPADGRGAACTDEDRTNRPREDGPGEA